jgi:hypothetical protein
MIATVMRALVYARELPIFVAKKPPLDGKVLHTLEIEMKGCPLSKPQGFKRQKEKAPRNAGGNLKAS